MSNPKIVAIVQARMSSSRLPGKVLRDVGGKPMLERVIARVSRSKLINQVVVATTDDPSDDLIADLCRNLNVPVFRGNLYDVLDRYYQAACAYQAEVVVRITADCPMIDPLEIDRVIAVFLEGGWDFAANRLPPPHQRTSPVGMDTEVCSFAALENAWKNATEKFEREHVMPYLYDKPGRFRVKVAEMEPSLGHLRFTVDTEADLKVARAVYTAFGNHDDFSLADLLEKNAQYPQWQYSLVDVQHKGYQDVDERASKEAHSTPLLPAASAPDAPETIACPLCSQQQAERLKDLDSFGANVRYYHCKYCGFVFQDAARSQAANPEFYKQAYRKIYQATETPTSKDLRQQQLRAADQIRFLRAQGAAQPKRILDIGASSGLLLDAFRQAFNAECIGVEPGESYRALAESRGLDMFKSIESLIASQPERFDLVSLMHVLEHLQDPVGVLRQIREGLLKEQGLLLLEVPNFYAHDSYELAHLSCFTPHTLRETLRLAGFEVLALRKHGYPRSEILKLYLNVLAKPAEKTQDPSPVRTEKAVPLKRKIAMLWRKALTRLQPRRAWLPLEDKN